MRSLQGRLTAERRKLGQWVRIGWGNGASLIGMVGDAVKANGRSIEPSWLTLENEK